MIFSTILMGLIAGIVSGLLGVGGGGVLVPLMVIVLGISQHSAQGISLLVIVPTAMIGVWHFHKRRLIDYRMAAYLAVGAVIGILISANFVQFIPGTILKKIFGVFVLFIGCQMIMSKTPK